VGLHASLHPLKEKEQGNFTLFSDHNGSLLRRQHGDAAPEDNTALVSGLGSALSETGRMLLWATVFCEATSCIIAELYSQHRRGGGAFSSQVRSLCNSKHLQAENKAHIASNTTSAAETLLLHEPDCTNMCMKAFQPMLEGFLVWTMGCIV